MGRDCPVFMSLVALIGRICISLLFIIAGIVHIMHYQEVSAMVDKVGMTSYHWLLIVAIVLELLGGVLVFLGWLTRLGAVLLILFAILVAISMHMFWSQHADIPQAYRYFEFLKNLTIFGGLLYVLAFGSGRFGFDSYRKSNTACM
jgi:putative oxidoreductase